MTKLSAWKTAHIALLLCAATVMAAHAQTFTTLVNFNGTDGNTPYFSPLTQGRDGNLFGVTYFGGLNNQGTIFKLSADGSLHTLYNFCSQTGCADGQEPLGALLLAEDGSLYGTTYQGGDLVCPFYTTCGTAYKISPQGVLTTLYSFCTQPSQEQCLDGDLPYSGVIQAVNQQFYGTTLQGGDNFYCSGGCGTLFKIASDGSLTTLASFTFPGDGDQPHGALTQGTDGNLYGTTYAGGVHGDGSIFKSTLQGAITLLYSFDGYTGSEVYGGLIEGSDGNFYGTTLYGGAYGMGIVFKITSTGTLTTVHSFNGADGSVPQSGVIQATDGNFYGTTTSGGAYKYGTVYQMTPAGIVTTLHSFAGSDGSGPNSSLIQATDGNFYGTTPSNSGGSCCGTVFRLSTGLSPFVRPVSYSGKVGQTRGILGRGFATSTSVAFNGVSATFTAVSDTFLKATVPAGATTGYVTVTTPSGTLTSNQPFHVIP